MASANDLRHLVHGRLLAIRNLHTVVNSDGFLEAYELATEAEKATIAEYVEKGDQKELTKLLRAIVCKDIGNMTIRQLRKVAQDYGIPRYNFLPKAVLLSEIKRRELSVATESNGRASTESKGRTEGSGEAQQES